MGALATGSAAAVGSGAFTSVEADRDITIEVAGDANAFLAFERERDEYIGDPDGGTLTISLGEPTTDEGGEGFNDRGLTRVDDIIGIRNQGTQPAGIGFGSAGDLDEDSQSTTVPLENVGSATAKVTLTLSENAGELDPGDGPAMISVDVDTNADPNDTEETSSVTLSGSSEAAGLDYDGDGNGFGGVG